MSCTPLLVVLLSTTLYLFYTTTTQLTTNGVEFMPFYPPIPPQDIGVLAINDKLTSVKQMAKGKLDGPESVVRDKNGDFYATCADGFIYKLTKNGEDFDAEKFLYVGGRPLGLKIDNNNNLIIAEPVKGLLSVNPETKEIKILTNSDDEGNPIWSANDLEISRSGDKIYFSDSTTVAPIKIGEKWVTLIPSVITIQSSNPLGRLLEYDVITRKTRVLMKGLVYSNGVALAKDESYVLVAETGKARVWKYHLTGHRVGTYEVFADNLPGYPDGISTTEDGNFLVALYTKRSQALETTLPFATIKKILVTIVRFVNILPPPVGLILKLDQNGNPIEVLYDPKGENISTISDVEEYDGKLYIASLTNKWFAVYTPESQQTTTTETKTKTEQQTTKPTPTPETQQPTTKQTETETKTQQTTNPTKTAEQTPKTVVDAKKDEL